MPFEDRRKKRCPDCLECQVCGETRCRVCRKCSHGNGISELSSGFTHREYLAWKKKRMEKCGENTTGH